jgi:hypothetical protein
MSRKKIHRGIAASLVVCRTITMLDYNADEFFLDNFEMGEELNENCATFSGLLLKTFVRRSLTRQKPD